MQFAIVLKKYILKAGVGEVIWAFLKGLWIILDIQVTVYACQPIDYYTPSNKEGKMFLTCLSVHQSCFICQLSSSEATKQNFMKL